MKKDNIKNEITKSSLIVIVLTFFGSGINYLCQILMGRYYSISNYGIINTLFSLILIISVIGTTSSMFITKLISNKENRFIKQIFKITNIIAVIFLIFQLIFFKQVGNLLNTNNILVIILSIITIVTNIYPIAFQGIFAGMSRFLSLGLYTLIIPIIKILSIVSIKIFDITNDMQIHITLIALLFANLFSIIVGIIYFKCNTKKMSFNQNKKNLNTNINKEYKDILITNMCLSFLVNIDVLYLNIYFSATETGLYSSALMFGRVIYYCVTALVTVMLPFVVSNTKDSKKILNQTLTYTIILVVLFLIPVNIFSKQLLTLVFGNRYDLAIPYIKYASIISVAYSLNTILVNYFVGIGKVKFLQKSLIIGAIVMSIILFITKPSKYIGLIIIAIFNIALFKINYIIVNREKKK